MRRYGTCIAAVMGIGLLAGPAVWAANGLGPGWVAGDGLWIVENGVCYAVALDDTDPKHAWVPGDFGDNYTVRCDVRIDSWKDNEDMSRAGIAVRIQPDVRDGVRDDGLCLLFHNNLGRVEFLNDMQSWGEVQESFDWRLGTWYTFEMTVSGTTLTGSIKPKRGTRPAPLEMTPWDASKGGTILSREGGFPGLTANSNDGGVVSFDNFEVIVDGQVVFSDDFETPGPPIATGLGPEWVAGDGVWVVYGGSLYGIALDDTDPKHAWVVKPFGNDYGVRADVRIHSWKENEDMSRAGIALRIQPDIRDGVRDDGLCLLFHNNLGRVEFLNDMQSWGAVQESFDWRLETWYTFEMSVTGTTLEGSVKPKRGTRPAPLTMTPWDASVGGTRLSREGGLAGLTANSNDGGVVAFDNFEVLVGGQVVYSANFDEFISPVAESAADNYELYK